jgi:hypothetical protein
MRLEHRQRVARVLDLIETDEMTAFAFALIQPRASKRNVT